MFDIFKSYLNKENYYLIITDDKYYIKNYKKIISIDNNELIILIDKRYVKINGKNMYVKQNIGNELLINGEIENIKFYD